LFVSKDGFGFLLTAFDSPYQLCCSLTTIRHSIHSSAPKPPKKPRMQFLTHALTLAVADSYQGYSGAPWEFDHAVISYDSIRRRFSQQCPY